MNLFTNLLISMALLLPATAYSQVNFGVTYKVDTARNVDILGPISIGKGLRVAQAILSKATGPLDQEIFLTVNSPGGSVVGGWFIIDAMSAAKTKGYKVTCVTGVLAASMAFNILAACDERWALPNAQLLWHPARIFTRSPVTADVMDVWTDELRSINGKIKKLILESSEMDEDFFDLHDSRETLHPAVNLVPHTKLYWINCVNNVEGAPSLLKVTDPRDGFMFGRKAGDEFDFGDADVEIVDHNKFLQSYMRGK